MAHQEYEELLTVYALDALDAPDRRQLEEHLEACSECRAELAEMRDAAGLLAHATTGAEPRAQVRERILNQVRSEGRSRQSSNEPSASVVEFRPRVPSSPWPNLLRLAAVIAFVALLIGVGVLWRRDTQSRQEVARLAQQLNQQNSDLSREREALARQREALEFLRSPGMKTMDLAGTPTAQAARATFIYDQKTGRGMLLTEGLPMAPAGMAYEVWFIPKGQSPMPGKTFTVDAAGKAMMMDQMPAEAMENAVVAITLEPEKGSASPTGPIYLASPAS
ncbi:MAG TPA: anti-sigma factor [Pyrinomonadaceae bacterium]|nr:anti-sigma factor [Pyrinomonadaceae bacterium]